MLGDIYKLGSSYYIDVGNVTLALYTTSKDYRVREFKVETYTEQANKIGNLGDILGKLEDT